jgi:hypothetical protein
MSRRNPILIATGALAGALIVLVAALAIAGSWPFDAASGDREVGGHRVVWDGQAVLSAGALYALDEPPVAAEGGCQHCLAVKSDARGRLELWAGNGILGWPRAGAPSYGDCIALRNHLTLDSVALGAPRTTLSAVALHGWMCATGGANDGLIRLRYGGGRGRRYVFDVTSWGRPAEG